MELVKKSIHTDRIKCSAAVQIPLEDDINITDARPDVYQLIEEQGEIIIDEIRVIQDHVYVKGKLQFVILYLSDDDVRRPSSMTGKIAFDEQVYMEGVCSADTVSVKKEVEDLNTGMINSRKLSVQALINLEMCVEEIRDCEAAVDLDDPETVEYRKKEIELAELAIRKKDIFRVRQELELPTGLPNIFEIFWDRVRLEGVQFGLKNGKLSIQGQIHLFCLYEGEGENRPVAVYETTVPFGGDLECFGLKEKMHSAIGYTIGQKQIEVKPDIDGEERLISLDLVLDLDLKIYEEEHAEILSDVYGVTSEVEAVTEVGAIKQLLMKNTGKLKASGHFKVADGMPGIRQICHSDSVVWLAEAAVVEEGLRLTGTVQVKLLYQTEEDEVPYDCLTGSIPFSYLLEIPGISSDCTWELKAEAEEIGTILMDAGEADVKVMLSFCAMVFRNFEEPLIRNIKVSRLDTVKISELPGIIAYIAGEGESLWDLGKKYYVPVSRIREMNDLEGDEIFPGDKILIVR